jgi:hypothetical protein
MTRICLFTKRHILIRAECMHVLQGQGSKHIDGASDEGMLKIFMCTCIYIYIYIYTYMHVCIYTHELYADILHVYII